MGMSGLHPFRGDRGLAWRGAVGSPVPWRFKSDGDAEIVYMCERHHIIVVNELLYGEARTGEVLPLRVRHPHHVST